MGKFAQMAQQVKKENAGEFTPLDLNDSNVQAVFNRCLETSRTKTKKGAVLFLKKFGYKDNSTPVAFDNDVLLANKQVIEYLFG